MHAFFCSFEKVLETKISCNPFEKFKPVKLYFHLCHARSMAKMIYIYIPGPHKKSIGLTREPCSFLVLNLNCLCPTPQFLPPLTRARNQIFNKNPLSDRGIPCGAKNNSGIYTMQLE